MQTVYNPRKNYFKLCCDHEMKQAKINGEKYDPEIMLQINSCFGKNRRHHFDGGVCELKNMDYTIEEQNIYWHNWHNVNMKSKNTKVECSLEEEYAEYKKLNNNVQDADIWAFITVGFDNKKIGLPGSLAYNLHIKEIEKIGYAISHLVYKQGAIKSIQYVIERHRENGIHHHIHFLFQFHIKVPPSDMITKIFGAKGMSEYCKEKNFIDYLGPQKPKVPHASLETYGRYILGDKKEEKLLFVEKDREWREKYNLNHLYIVE
jgi:hypothetical protein